MSKIEEQVIDIIRQRAEAGKEKYGTTMERDDLDVIEWLKHIQEELLDGAIYIEKTIEVLTDLKANVSKLIIESVEGRNRLAETTNELLHLAIKSVEREKALARLEAEVEQLKKTKA